jgi:hypothetical protein
MNKQQAAYRQRSPYDSAYIEISGMIFGAVVKYNGPQKKLNDGALKKEPV